MIASAAVIQHSGTGNYLTQDVAIINVPVPGGATQLIMVPTEILTAEELEGSEAEFDTFSTWGDVLDMFPEDADHSQEDQLRDQVVIHSACGMTFPN
jgi:hypothetical protein